MSKEIINTKMQVLTLVAQGNPMGKVTPQSIGQEYVDTTTGRIFKAVGLGNNQWAFIGQGNASNDFTPDQMSNLAFWFDASDKSLLTLDSENNISSFSSRINNVILARNSTPSWKYQENLQNGRGGAFNPFPNDQVMQYIREGFSFQFTQGLSAYMVIKPTVLPGYYMRLMGFHDNNRWYPWSYISTAGNFHAEWGTGDVQIAPVVLNQPVIFWFRFSGTNRGDQSFLSGVNNQQTFNNTWWYENYNVRGMAILGNSNGYAFRGQFFEQLTFFNQISEDDHQKILTYLNSKWAIY